MGAMQESIKLAMFSNELLGKKRRLTKDKITKHKRYTQAKQFRAKKIQQLREKRSAESEIDKEMRLNKQKEYNDKRSAESDIGKKRRQTKDKATHKKRYGQPTKDWKQELIDKASLTHICTSECRYRPKASMVVVTDKMFTSEEMKLLTINNETLSIDGKYYVCKYCKNIIKKTRFHHVMK